MLFIPDGVMLSISKIVNKWHHLILLAGFCALGCGRALADGACDPHVDETFSHVGADYVSRLCLDKFGLVTLRYKSKSHLIAIETRAAKKVVRVIPKGAQPEDVGYEDRIRILPRRLQPYLGDGKLLIITSERSSTGSGGGECGAGAEVYLTVVNIIEDKLKPISLHLINSCLKNIEMDGGGEASNPFGGFFVGNHGLAVRFNSYGSSDGAVTGYLSQDLSALDMSK